MLPVDPIDKMLAAEATDNMDRYDAIDRCDLIESRDCSDKRYVMSKW